MTGDSSYPPLQDPTGEPLPLTVLTGFLGAGKTTLLNRLLRDPAMKDSLVLVNEVGEIGIDQLGGHCDAMPQRVAVDAELARRAFPLAAMSQVALHGVAEIDPRMPLKGSETVDKQAVDLLSEWIRSLPAP